MLRYAGDDPLAVRPAMTIVRSTYRYKPPPRKKPQVATIEVPAVITIRGKRRVHRSDALSGDPVAAQRSNAATPDEPTPTDDERKSAIVTASRPKVSRPAADAMLSAIVTAR